MSEQDSHDIRRKITDIIAAIKQTDYDEALSTLAILLQGRLENKLSHDLAYIEGEIIELSDTNDISDANGIRNNLSAIEERVRQAASSGRPYFPLGRG